MKGLELSRRYYREVGEPALRDRFGDRASRFSAGLVGEGSECSGYDDGISADHDYGPGFCLWLTKEDYEAVGKEVQAVYDSLPGEFLGVPPGKETASAGKRVGVWEISAFYARFVGPYQPPRTGREWLYLREDKLAEAVKGQVFCDPIGEFSRIRRALGGYYPEDVRIKKIAARCAVMARTAPGEFEGLRGRLKEPKEEALALIDRIVSLELKGMAEYRRRYPCLAEGNRPLTAREDGGGSTSFETYLWGELHTYSPRTLALYRELVEGLDRAGTSLTLAVMDHMVKAYGYRDLEEAERHERLRRAGRK